jgi:hypothetical protein
MAANYQQVFLAILRADASQAVTEFRKVEGQVEQSTASSASKFTQFSSLAKGALVGVGAAAAFSLGKTAVNAAVDLNESVNAVNVTFGNASDEVLALGENSAKAFGLSTSEFNSLAVSFSSFADKIVGPGGNVADVIQDLATRAADFASVVNVDVNEAASVFMSTLAGETEAIRRFGKDVSAAAVEQYALEKGLVASKSEMTESIKVQARYGLLMEQTSGMADDFANTSGSLANQQKILSKELENAAASIGQKLVPAIESMMPAILVAVDGLELLATGVGGVFGAAETLGTKLGQVLSPWNAGAREANAAITDAFNASEAAAREFDMTLLDSVRSVEEAQQVARGYGLDAHAANTVTLEWKASQEKLGNTVYGTTQQWRELRYEQTYAADIGSELNLITELGSEAARKYGMAAQFAADETNNLYNEFVGLKNELSDRSDFLTMAQGFDDIETAATEAFEAAATGSTDAASKARDFEQAVIDQKLRVLEFGESIAGLPEQSTTDILALIDAGKFDEAERRLQNLARPRDVAFQPRVIGGTRIRMDEFGNLQQFADGGVVAGPRGSAQLVMAHGGETILPTHKTGLPGGGPGVVNNYAVNVSANSFTNGIVVGQQIVEALKKYERANGTSWRS